MHNKSIEHIYSIDMAQQQDKEHSKTIDQELNFSGQLTLAKTKDDLISTAEMYGVSINEEELKAIILQKKFGDDFTMVS